MKLSRYYLGGLAVFFGFEAFYWGETYLAGVGMILTVAGLLWLERDEAMRIDESDKELVREFTDRVVDIEKRVAAVENVQNVRRAVGR